MLGVCRKLSFRKLNRLAVSLDKWKKRFIRFFLDIFSV